MGSGFFLFVYGAIRLPNELKAAMKLYQETRLIEVAL
jgi:hypothetical protein